MLTNCEVWSPREDVGGRWPLFLPEPLSGPCLSFVTSFSACPRPRGLLCSGPCVDSIGDADEISRECAAEGPSLRPSLVPSAGGGLEDRAAVDRQQSSSHCFWTLEHIPGPGQGSSHWPRRMGAPTPVGFPLEAPAEGSWPTSLLLWVCRRLGPLLGLAEQILSSSEPCPPSPVATFSLRRPPFPTFLLGTFLGSSSVGLPGACCSPGEAERLTQTVL